MNMTAAFVTLIDYGVGNLFSVRRAFEHCGAQVLLTADPTEIAQAERLVLPGVGAFANGMHELRARGLIAPIQEYARADRPFLGICLGMQMMLEISEEFGTHAGLGLIPGKVIAVPSSGATGAPHKVPHIGWNDIHYPVPGIQWEQTILEGLPQDASVYFVHSFTAFPADESHRLADCDYDGCRLSAVIRSGNLYGCQFHPEKSGENGLRIIRNFLALPAAAQ